MPRRALIAFGAVFAIGLLALVAIAARERRSESFTLGVVPVAPVGRLAPDRELCQRPIEVIDSFERVLLQVGTFGREGQPFLLDVRDASSAKSIARARVDGGYADNESLTVTLPRTVPEGARVAVCVRNVGEHSIAPYGNSGLATRTSAAYRNGHRLAGDMSLVFLRAKPATVLGQVPSIVERASLFHGSWGSTTAYWLLLVVLLVAPASLAALAIRASLS
jgi:hypothetical protein